MSAPRPSGRLLAGALFLDVESSGLGPGSFPVEVAACDDALRVASWTVRPAPGWVEWSPGAEAMHGLSLDRLGAEGEDPALVARALAEAVGAAVAVSDAPEADTFWLDRLYAAAGLARPFRVLDAAEALLGLGASEAEAVARARAWDGARAAAARHYPHRHRAGPDAMGLAAAWRAAADPGFLDALARSPLTQAPPRGI